MAKNLMKISVSTLPNGYALTVGGNEFMYFNEVDLLAGFMAHVGACETSSLDKGSILSALMSAMLGDAYANTVTTLKQRVGLLTSQYTTTIDRMDKALEYVSQVESTIDSLMKRIEDVGNQVKGTAEEYACNKKEVDETKLKLDDIEKKANKVMESLANSATIMKAMEEAGAANKKENAEATECQTVEESAPKKRGRRSKAADEKVLKEIKKKAKKNPNIK